MTATNSSQDASLSTMDLKKQSGTGKEQSGTGKEQSWTRNQEQERWKWGNSQILDWIYLGMFPSKRDEHVLQQLGIKHVIGIYHKAYLPPVVFDEKVVEAKNHHYFEAHDHPQAWIDRYFFPSYQILEQIRLKKEKVLVHCGAGISRSPALVVAYLMRHKLWSLDATFEYVKSKRNTVQLMHFAYQLARYEVHVFGGTSTAPDYLKGRSRTDFEKDEKDRSTCFSRPVLWMERSNECDWGDHVSGFFVAPVDLEPPIKTQEELEQRVKAAFLGTASIRVRLTFSWPPPDDRYQREDAYQKKLKMVFNTRSPVVLPPPVAPATDTHSSYNVEFDCLQQNYQRRPFGPWTRIDSLLSEIAAGTSFAGRAITVSLIDPNR